MSDKGKEYYDEVKEKGVKITDAQMRQLAVTKDKALPKWNYTISPV